MGINSLKQVKKNPVTNKNKVDFALISVFRKYNLEYVIEHKFDTISQRKYRFDYALPEYKIAIEIEGGVMQRGGHSNSFGILKDIEKGNIAIINGWSMLRFSTFHKEDYIKKVLETLLVVKGVIKNEGQIDDIDSEDDLNYETT